MANSFTTQRGTPAVLPATRAVLVTGAAGRIGSFFARTAKDRYALRLMIRGDEPNIDEIRPFGEIVSADLSDLPKLTNHCQGIDTLVHLAGDPSPDAGWDQLLNTNIIGTYNVFVAAKAMGVRRVVYASSIHAVSGYPVDYQVHTDDPINPGDLYGVSKCFGEALSRYMAQQEGMSAICLRIGCFQPVEKMRGPAGIQMLDGWVSQPDLAQLICRCIDDQTLRFAIFHGLSNNRFNRLDITDARELVGYEPEDDITRTNEQLSPLHLQEKIQHHNVGDRRGVPIPASSVKANIHQPNFSADL